MRGKEITLSIHVDSSGEVVEVKQHAGQNLNTVFAEIQATETDLLAVLNRERERLGLAPAYNHSTTTVAFAADATALMKL